MEIPSGILKPQNKIPLYRYSIDRQTLLRAGVASETCDQIYRSLFVHSVGFFDQLKKQLAKCDPSKVLSLQMSLWKVYAILLEYACRTDYKLLITEQLKQQQEQFQKLTQEHQAAQAQLEYEKSQLAQNMQVM